MIPITVTEAKAKFLQLIRRSDRAFERFLITKAGKPQAVLMSADEYDGWLETLEILSDKKSLAEIRKARRALKAGRGRSFEEIFGRPQSTKRK